MSQRLIRRQIPVAITIVTGLVIAVAYFTVQTPINDASTMLQSWLVVIGGIAAVMGSIAVVLHSAGEVMARKSSSWMYSVITIATFATAFVPGVLYGVSSNISQLIQTKGVVLLSNCILGLGAIYQYYTVYRSFRSRNTEVLIFFAVAILTWLYGTTLGPIIPGIMSIGTWLIAYPTVAGTRAVLVGAMLGASILGVRTLLGQEEYAAAV